MARQRYPNFRRAQRERGPYYRGPRIPPQRRFGFPVVVVLSCAAMSTVILVGDRVPAMLDAAALASRNLGRDHAPPPGAYYSGCNEAGAAGVAPIYADEPGYRPEMDGDGDGIACEPYHGR